MNERFDIPYSADHGDRRRCDLFVPAGVGSGAAVLLIHGGGFAGGDKAQWHGVARRLCRGGYACASIEYRLAPRWKFPAWVEDCRAGMAWFRRQAGEIGFEAARVAAVGSSAGAYLALMLATIGPDDDLGATAETAGADTRPAAVVAYCPAYSMHEERRWPSRTAYPGLMPAPEADDPDLYRRASVEDRIAGGEPPVLILHGTADELIPIDESEQLIARLRAAGDEAELVPIEGAAHGFGYGVETGFQKTAVARAERYLKERV